MIKLVIFDLDGVLIDSRDLHFYSLNNALESVGEQYVINRKEHLSTYDGLSTSKKLSMLSKSKGLPESLHGEIWKRKQEETLKLLSYFGENSVAVKIMEELRSRDIKIAVASNSIRRSVQVALHSIGVLHLVDYIVSNEDVTLAKPYPEMYWKCMTAFNVLPDDTMIIEDSHIGRMGAINSGAQLHAIKNSDDLSYANVMIDINKQTSEKEKGVPWRSNEMNVLIPMAGAGSRFASAGYTFPKPLIEVQGKPMIQKVVENLNIDAHYIFIVQKEHYEKYNLQQLLNLVAPGCDIVVTEGMTEGAACTTLLAKEIIDNDAPLLIANSDQIVDWNSNETLYVFTASDIDAGILCFNSTHPKWSFAKLDEDGFVSEVAEKNPISDLATVGIYFWKKGSDYVKYAESMISKDIRTNNEFYVCPVFNEAILDGKKIKTSLVERMWGIGTPEDLNTYLEEHQ